MTLYQSRQRRRRFRASTMLAGIGAMLMLACLVLGVDLKVRGPNAWLAPAGADPVPAPVWVPPSHPVGTGESLYLQNGTGR